MGSSHCDQRLNDQETESNESTTSSLHVEETYSTTVSFHEPATEGGKTLAEPFMDDAADDMSDDDKKEDPKKDSDQPKTPNDESSGGKNGDPGSFASSNTFTSHSPPDRSESLAEPIPENELNEANVSSNREASVQDNITASTNEASARSASPQQQPKKDPSTVHTYIDGDQFLQGRGGTINVNTGSGTMNIAGGNIR
jgi:hypothetical protein